MQSVSFVQRTPKEPVSPEEVAVVAPASADGSADASPFDGLATDATGDAAALDPVKQLQRILDCVLPPRKIQESGQFFVQRASPTPSTRLDLIALQEKFDATLEAERAKAFGICPIRRRIYDDLFDELIRQVTVSCAERGLLLLRVRDEIRLTLIAYQGVLESAVAYGIRKAVSVESQQTSAVVERDAERVRNAELKSRIAHLKKQLSTERLIKEEEVRLLEQSMRDENNRLLESNRTLKMHLQSIIQMDQQMQQQQPDAS